MDYVVSSERGSV